ncbi:hypothetical protein [Robinsoniella sp. KNHs210]|uniref:hypothetical protein n=1 Tax=Robinsoniella sp. KNHs210 TaxID=1469950 RepID=UPI000489D7BF|nr:hypothetical protein [Robinsoniella sp. KNHs210]
MATRKIVDLTQATTSSDADLMVIQDTSKTKKITFSTLLTNIKSKLKVGTAANLNTTSKEIVGAINEINTNFDNINKQVTLAAGISGTVTNIAVGRLRILSFDINVATYTANTSVRLLTLQEIPLQDSFCNVMKGYSSSLGEHGRVMLAKSSKEVWGILPAADGSVRGTLVYMV